MFARAGQTADNSPMPRRPLPHTVTLLATLALAACRPLPAKPDGTATAIEAPAATGPHPANPGPGSPDVLRGPPLAGIRQEPQLRIRIQANLTGIRIGRGPTLISTDAKAQPHTFTGPLQVTRQGAGFILTDAKGARWTWAAPLLVARAPQGAMSVGTQTYQGTVELAARGPSGMDLINDLPLEAYLPGVLAKELYTSWQPEAYRAQAITARSYAIWEMTKRRAEGRAFDLEAGEASQAYVGVTGNAKANQAVAATRGVVLTYDNRVLPAFYSACAGGAAQDAVFAFPNRVADLPPLRGHPTGTAAAICPRFNWPTLARDKNDTLRRLAAWGAAEKHPVAGLRSLQAARVSGLSRSNRPAMFELTDDQGRVFALSCEDFRLALNGGTPAVPAEKRLLSSFCSVRVSGTQLLFENGHGHGHGVGLEQWGAEGMAQKGQKAEAILGAYYPGAVLQRAY